VCELRTDGDPIELTPGIDLVSYRVIETALERGATAGWEHANITVRYEPQRLELEVRGGTSLPEGGEALRSVSERVRLYGGALDVLDSQPGEFTVRCRLPLERAFTA
jgi:signal transduction histidine kinase